MTEKQAEFCESEDKNNLTYLAFGAGVQSTALYILSDRGEQGVPRADAAIFADTQNEPAWVYEQVERMQAWGTIPIHVVTQGDLGADLLDRMAGNRKSASTIPLWTRGANGKAAPLMRACTRDYKVRPIERKARELMGYGKRGRIQHHATALVGISIDEVVRMKPNPSTWIDNIFPLVDAGLTRRACLDLVVSAGMPRPLRSACVYCPYHDNWYWEALKREYPAEFNKASNWDRRFRDASGAGVVSPTFVHRSLKSLRTAEFPLIDAPLFGDFADECEGMCGV